MLGIKTLEEFFYLILGFQCPTRVLEQQYRFVVLSHNQSYHWTLLVLGFYPRLSVCSSSFVWFSCTESWDCVPVLFELSLLLPMYSVRMTKFYSLCCTYVNFLLHLYDDSSSHGYPVSMESIPCNRVSMDHLWYRYSCHRSGFCFNYIRTRIRQSPRVSPPTCGGPTYLAKLLEDTSSSQNSSFMHFTSEGYASTSWLLVSFRNRIDRFQVLRSLQNAIANSLPWCYHRCIR